MGPAAPGVDPGVRTDVVVVGAGQAGLSAASGLARAGADFVVVDGEDGPGGAWRHRWPTLRVDDAHRIHDLPGLRFAPADPTRPAAEVVPEYFADYEREFGIEVLRPVHVHAVRDAAPDLVVETDRGDWTARALINATGTWTRPFVPRYPGTFAGRQLHTAEYRGPDGFAGKRVVVVGGGTSAVQLLIEIAGVAASTRWFTRREPVFSDGPFDGRAAVARVEERVRAGLPPRSVVGVTGLLRTPAVAAAQEAGILHRLPMFTRLVPEGVVRADPRVHLVGYGPSASTIGANRAGRAAARDVLRGLARAA